MDMIVKRTDSNQKEIMDALRKAGYSVFDLHCVGKGFPDIIVGCHNHNILVEIKSEGGKLNELEHKFFNTWQGPMCVVNSVEEALTSVDKVVRYLENK